MKCLLSLIRYTSNTLKVKLRLKDFAETNVGDQVPMLATKRWRTRVKALVQTNVGGNEVSAPTSPLAATCATDVGFSLPNPFHPAALPSLIRATDCTLPKSDARILSHCHPTEPRCTLVNMSKVGRAPWTHMSHFLDMSHCALNSLPL